MRETSSGSRVLGAEAIDSSSVTGVISIPSRCNRLQPLLLLRSRLLKHPSRKIGRHDAASPVQQSRTKRRRKPSHAGQSSDPDCDRQNDEEELPSRRAHLSSGDLGSGTIGKRSHNLPLPRHGNSLLWICRRIRVDLIRDDQPIPQNDAAIGITRQNRIVRHQHQRRALQYDSGSAAAPAHEPHWSYRDCP